MCFGQSEVSAIERSSNVEQTSFEVDIGPLKAKELRHSHPRDRNQENEGTMRFFQMVQHHLKVSRLKRHIGLNRIPVRKVDTGNRIVLQVSPLSCAATYTAHRSPYVVQYRRCVTFGLLVEEYLQTWCANVTQAVLREFGHQVSSKDIPVEVSCGHAISGQDCLLPLSSEVREQHCRMRFSETLIGRP